jgi:hypothetical protein
MFLRCRAAADDHYRRWVVRCWSNYLDCVVLDEGVLDDAAVGAAVFVDFTGRFAERLGTIHGTVLAARADGYVASHQTRFALGLDRRPAAT